RTRSTTDADSSSHSKDAADGLAGQPYRRLTRLFATQSLFFRQHPAIPFRVRDGRRQWLPIVVALAQRHFLALPRIAQVNAIDTPGVLSKELDHTSAAFLRVTRVQDQVNQRRIRFAQHFLDLRAVLSELRVVIVVSELQPVLAAETPRPIESLRLAVQGR